MSHRAQQAAAQRAEEIFAQTGKRSFPFEMPETIGEGFTKGGGALIRTSNVQAVFRQGKLYTLFPLVRPLKP